jgi:peptidoglycan LD-endopeptidase LytH
MLLHENRNRRQQLRPGGLGIKRIHDRQLSDLCPGSKVIIESMNSPKPLLGLIILGALVGLALFTYRQVNSSAARTKQVWSFLNDPAANAQLVIKAGTRCGSAPFIFPTDGMIGYLWDDSFSAGHRHQGIDIFAGTDVGVTPVYAVYPGYLTRAGNWKSAVIVRVPRDPLQPGRQIWVYYTHMADSDGNSFISAEFPPGTSERYVEAGTLLGYQGNFSGDPGNPVGVHLHLSIVRDDGAGRYLNELKIENTYDPSPYLGLDLNANLNPDRIPVCGGQ